MARKIIVKRTVRYTAPVIRVTRSGKLFCNNCGCWNTVTVGMKNPVCGRCDWPLA